MGEIRDQLYLGVKKKLKLKIKLLVYPRST